MKKYSFYILCLAALCGCGNKEQLLINQVPVTTVVNPAIGSIIKNNTIVYARMDSGVVIHGVTSAESAFRTANYFTNFDLNTFSLMTPVTSFAFNGNRCAYGAGSAQVPAVDFSANFGKTWTTITPTFSPALPTTGFYYSQFIGWNPVGDNEVLGLYVEQTYSNGNIRDLYKIDVTAKTASLVSSIQDSYIPSTMKFADAKTGWMVLSNSGTWVSGTTDGGITWSKPVEIDPGNLNNLRVNGSGQVAVYSTNGAYFSVDNGVTWKKGPASVYFYDVALVDATHMFALTEGGVEKSTDGGITWTYVSMFVTNFSNVQNIFFEDAQNGLAYGEQRLYITADGGQTWRTLLYPYPYVMQ